METFEFILRTLKTRKKCFMKNKSATVWRSDLRWKLEGDEIANAVD